MNRFHYYSFGMQMPGRSYTAPNGGYRYGFNGKEMDKEMHSLTAYDYGFRIYNPALGKFLSVDPLAPEYPWYTPYQFAGNKPIWALDLDGLEDIIYTDKIFMDEKFGKAQALMVSTEMGLKASMDVWDTENKTIKQDVYFVLSKDASLFRGSRNYAFTATFSSAALKKGKYKGEYKKGDTKFKLQFGNDKVDPALRQIGFFTTTYKESEDINVSVIFINKKAVDKLSIVDYSNVLYHELKAHVVRNIDLPADSEKRSASEDHEEYHGTKSDSSPAPGNEKKGSIMSKYLKQARESWFNPDKKGNVYEPDSSKPTSVKEKNQNPSQSKTKL